MKEKSQTRKEIEVKEIKEVIEPTAKNDRRKRKRKNKKWFNNECKKD